MAGKPTHGDSYPTMHPIYNAWRNMNKRCSNPNTPTFKNYGGRGIKVCAEWQTDYVAFREWALSNGYERGLTLDRENNNLGYFPENCRWITQQLNKRNTRSNKLIEAFGETKCLAEWAEDRRCKVKYNTLVRRVLAGWSPETSINQAPS